MSSENIKFFQLFNRPKRGVERCLVSTRMKKKPPKILDYFILIHAPSHSRAIAEGYVPEQILVAEKTLGRELSADEEVRHVNGNAHDNRPANLEVISMNAGYKSQVLGVDPDGPSRRGSNKTFVPCRYQRPCWKTVREPIARTNNVYLPYLCSFQTEGDIYRCSRFWKFLDDEMQEGKIEDTKE